MTVPKVAKFTATESRRIATRDREEGQRELTVQWYRGSLLQDEDSGDLFYHSVNIYDATEKYTWKQDGKFYDIWFLPQ